MKNLNWLLIIIIIAATSGIFFLIGGPEKDCLSYINLALVIFLEIIVLGCIFWNKENAQRLASTAQVVYYAIMCGAWMLIFNFFLYDIISIHWYYSIFLLLTINYSAVLIFLLQAGHHQQQLNSTCACNEHNRMDDNSKYRHTLHKLKAIPNEEAKICYEKLRLPVEKLMVIPTVTRNKNEAFMSICNNRLEDIEQKIDILQTLDDEKEKSIIFDRIKNVAEDLNQYLSEEKNKLY